MKNIIICAAKTGGHIFPALSFSKEALKNNNKITLIIASSSRYSFYLSSMPISTQCKYYNNDQISLINNLSSDEII